VSDRSDVIMVLAKEPVPGRVKTRLQPEFSALEAADLAAQAIQDTLTAVADTSIRCRRLVLDGDPAGRPWSLAQRGITLVPQRPGSLGDRLAGAFLDCTAPGGLRTHSSRPHLAALLIGMDTPQVSRRLLEVDWEGAGAVLGLSEDGGFWAIGLRGVDPAACFAGVPMSTARTGAAQLARLVDLGLSVKLLPPLRDVDEPSDAEAVAYRFPELEFSRCYRSIIDARFEQTADRLFDDAYRGVALQVDEHRGRALTMHTLTMDVARWTGRADAVDQMVVARCEAPVLDLGCGPGRMVRALVEAGVCALGIDMSAEAVELAQRRGGPALRARLEERLPGEGRWGTVLLVDGNVGIGGDVSTLLRRCRELVGPGGLIVCEVDTHQDGQTSAWVVLRSSASRSGALRWSRVGAAGLKGLAAELDLFVVEEWSAGRRAFVALRAA
jgi:glycosyltransferase A (GT-A) superfamily protein (DUF2064 family)/SAM-dependent methyltransferase